MQFTRTYFKFILLTGHSFSSGPVKDILVSRQNFEDAFKKVRPSVSKKVRTVFTINSEAVVRPNRSVQTYFGLGSKVIYLISHNKLGAVTLYNLKPGHSSLQMHIIFSVTGMSSTR